MDRKVKPLKRHEALVRFSREHHAALLMTWKVRQGIKNKVSAKRISNYLLFCFDKLLRQHFLEEETGIFAAETTDHTLARQAVAEHETLYCLVNHIERNKNDYSVIAAFADVLEAHIRFEERILFNEIQKSYPAVGKAENSSKNPYNRENEVDDQWEDKFWIRRKTIENENEKAQAH